MASNSVVGALRVHLGLDSAQFSEGLKNAQTGLARFGSLARTAGLAIGAAMVTAGGAMAAAMRGVINEADEMYKLSQSIGVPIGELSKLKYAADLSGVSLEELGRSVRRLSAGMYDAASKGTGPAAEAFKALGVSVRNADGTLRSSTDVMADIATKFRGMNDGAAKTAMAMRIFGKSGADMIPMLNQGAEGLQQMYHEAEELGLVLDEQTGKAAEAFNDNLTRLGKVKDGIVTKITANMLPALEGLSAGLVEASKNSNLMRVTGWALGNTLRFLATAAVTTGGFFIALAQDIGMAAKAAFYWTSGNYASAMVTLSEGNRRRQETLNGIRSINNAIWNPPASSGPPPAVEGLEQIEAAGGRARRSVERMSEAEREAAREAEELRREGERVFEQTRTPAEKYAAEVERLNRLLAAAAINQDTFNRAMEAARQSYEETLVNPLDKAKARRDALDERMREKANEVAAQQKMLADDHARNMRDATYDGVMGGLYALADGDLGKYLAARLRHQLFESLASGITDLLNGGRGKGGGGWMSAIGGLFSRIPGFATGGSIKVGGIPGADKNLVAFRASKGERVDIRRPGQVEARSAGGQVIHVEPSKYFDVRVQEVSMPLAAGAYSSARSTVPADIARTNRYTRTRGR